MAVLRDPVGHEITVPDEAVEYFPGYEVVEDDKKPAKPSAPADKNKE